MSESQSTNLDNRVTTLEIQLRNLTDDVTSIAQDVKELSISVKQQGENMSKNIELQNEKLSFAIQNSHEKLDKSLSEVKRDLQKKSETNWSVILASVSVVVVLVTAVLSPLWYHHNENVRAIERLEQRVFIDVDRNESN